MVSCVPLVCSTPGCWALARSSDGILQQSCAFVSQAVRPNILIECLYEVPCPPRFVALAVEGYCAKEEATFITASTRV